MRKPTSQHGDTDGCASITEPGQHSATARVAGGLCCCQKKLTKLQLHFPGDHFGSRLPTREVLYPLLVSRTGRLRVREAAAVGQMAQRVRNSNPGCLAWSGQAPAPCCQDCFMQNASTAPAPSARAVTGAVTTTQLSSGQAGARKFLIHILAGGTALSAKAWARILSAVSPATDGPCSYSQPSKACKTHRTATS